MCSLFCICHKLFRISVNDNDVYFILVINVIFYTYFNDRIKEVKFNR